MAKCRKGEEINYLNKIICGHTLDILKQMPDEIFDTIITSPPYWGLRDYGVERQIGLEPTLDLYLSHLWQITDELKRVLKKTGVLYWNHGDCYGGNNSRASQGGRAGFGTSREGVFKNTIIPKCLAMQNYRLVLGMIDRGWILRNSIIWSKPNHMPSSVKDRFTSSYEPVFMLVKNKKYWFDLDAVRQPHLENSQRKYECEARLGPIKEHLKDIPYQIKRRYNDGYRETGKNPGDVWTISTQGFPEAHFATFPEKLIQPMILSSCPQWICKKCGKARVRISKSKRNYHYIRTDTGKPRKKAIVKLGGKSALPSGKQFGKIISQNYQTEHTTIGWSDCGCNAGWRAGITFDPFIGSGTTGLVAKKLGRNYCGIELNPEYKKMADKRLMAIPDSLFKCH